jgi:hypothetical protein
MDQVRANGDSPTSAVAETDLRIIKIPKQSVWGFWSASTFLFAAAVELIFFIGVLFAVDSLPAGTVDTLPFSSSVGVALMLGQFVHIFGIICGVVGIRRDQERTLAFIGVIANSAFPVICLLSSILAE